MQAQTNLARPVRPKISCYEDFMKQLQTLSDSELLLQTRSLVSRERALTTELLAHLREVERRRLYAEQGYSSLFDYVRRGLGYCEGVPIAGLAPCGSSKSCHK